MFILQRPAIAMLELIFAIVIMGIVLMSAPMLISTAAKTTSVVLQQEGINQASSRINMILTYPWDQNDTNDSCIPPVLHVTDGDPELDINASTKRRLGVPLGSNSHTSKCGNIELNASLVLGQEGLTLDDIDDFIDLNGTLLNVAGGAGGQDYLEQGTVRIVTNVDYLQDNTRYNNVGTIIFFPNVPAVARRSTNIKRISVVITSTSPADTLEKTITLNAFSANIGGIEYESRLMP